MQNSVAVQQIPVEKCFPSERQARTRDVDKDLDDLINSIKVHGQLEPILVAPLKERPGEYEIIAGQRRWLALRALRRPTVTCSVLDGVVDDVTARVLSISENVIRRDLGVNDMIDACTELYRKYGSMKAVALELGLPYDKVRAHVKFERLRPQLRDLVKRGVLDIRTALRIEDHFGENSGTPEAIESAAEAVKGKTRAQVDHYFKGGPRNRRRRQSGAADPTQTATEVKQVIVTLHAADHHRLQELARIRRTTQDKAAAAILHAFLSNRP